MTYEFDEFVFDVSTLDGSVYTSEHTLQHLINERSSIWVSGKFASNGIARVEIARARTPATRSPAL